MSSTPSTRLVFDDFSKGEYNLKGSYKAEAGHFTGTNVMVYRDGSIGPRPGLKKNTITGNVNGVVRAMHYVGRSGKMLLIVIGNTLYSTSDDKNWTMTALGTTMSAAATEWGPLAIKDPNDKIYYSNPGDNLYEIDWPTGAVTAVTVAGANRGGRVLQFYGDILYMSGDRTSPAASNPGHRVYYSDPAAFATFPAANYYDVGYFWEVLGLVPIPGSLLVWHREKGWWSQTGYRSTGGGLDPATAWLRHVWPNDMTHIDDGPHFQELVYENGKVWFFRNGNYLVTSDGSTFDDKTYGHLQAFPTGSNRHGLYFNNDGQDIIFNDPSGTSALHRHWGTWVKHDWGVSVSGPMSNTETRNRALLVGGDAANANANYYSFHMALDRPGFVSDTYARPGDDSDTPLNADFYLPDLYNQSGKAVRIRQVIVDIKRWDIGTSGNNQIVLDVRAKARPGIIDYTSSTQTWTDAMSNTTSGGKIDRVVFNVGQVGWGAGVQLGFTDLIGVAIRRIEVVVEEAEEVPVQ